MWECVCVYQPVCMPLWLSIPLEQTRKDQIYVYSRPSARSSWCTKTLLVPHEFRFRLPPLLIDSGVEWLTDWQARSIDNKDRIECTSVWQLPPPIVCPYPLSLSSPSATISHVFRLICQLTRTLLSLTTRDRRLASLLLLLLSSVVTTAVRSRLVPSRASRRDRPALAMGAVELLDGVPVPLDVAVPGRRCGVDAALALLEAAWWGLGCVCYACYGQQGCGFVLPAEGRYVGWCSWGRGCKGVPVEKKREMPIGRQGRGVTHPTLRYSSSPAMTSVVSSSRSRRLLLQCRSCWRIRVVGCLSLS